MNNLDVSVEEYTTPNPITAPEEIGIDQLSALMKEHGIRHIPIVRDSQVVGVVSDRDLKVVLCLDLKEKSLVQAGDIMTHDPVTVHADARLEDVAMDMSARKIGSVLVNDGDNLLGIFTVTDALNALIETLRESR